MAVLPIEELRWMVSKAIDLCSARCLGKRDFSSTKIPPSAYKGTATSAVPKRNGELLSKFQRNVDAFPNVKTFLESSGHNKFGSIKIDN